MSSLNWGHLCFTVHLFSILSLILPINLTEVQYKTQIATLNKPSKYLFISFDFAVCQGRDNMCIYQQILTLAGRTIKHSTQSSCVSQLPPQSYEPVRPLQGCEIIHTLGMWAWVRIYTISMALWNISYNIQSILSFSGQRSFSTLFWGNVSNVPPL